MSLSGGDEKENQPLFWALTKQRKSRLQGADTQLYSTQNKVWVQVFFPRWLTWLRKKRFRTPVCWDATRYQAKQRQYKIKGIITSLSRGLCVDKLLHYLFLEECALDMRRDLSQRSDKKVSCLGLVWINSLLEEERFPVYQSLSIMWG